MINQLPSLIDQISSGEDSSGFQCLKIILNTIDALIYVSDIKTYELIFLNRYGRTEWQKTDQQQCFHHTNEQTGTICEFCTNTRLTDNNNEPLGVHSWEYENPISNKWFHSRVQAIKWPDGRIVRFEMATDITRYKNNQSQLKVAFDQARSDANIDPLLNCLNRRAFFERFEIMLAHCLRHKHPLALAMIDIDNFKAFNDKYGHRYGDQILLNTMKVFEKSIRESDIFARYGGDEFILALPATNQANALELLTRIQKDMAKIAKMPGTDHSVSISFGLTSLTDKSNVDILLNQADIALYRAKNAGRNRIEVYQQ